VISGTILAALAIISAPNFIQQVLQQLASLGQPPESLANKQRHEVVQYGEKENELSAAIRNEYGNGRK